MIIKNTTQAVESFNVGRTSQFKILADALAFKSLSEGLYSNKIRAVVREYTSNGVDAHIASNKASTPVKVHLPNRFEPFFSVQDQGTGLSEDAVMELFVTYFDSSKRQCELQNGGFGLGSKSAFAYGKSFTITSIFDGYKKVYSAYIDESGLPTMARLAEEATTDSNGVEIKVPVEMKDLQSFTDEASFVYEYYPVRPEVVGATVVYGKHEYKLQGTDWKMEASNGHSEVYALVGSIAYKVESNEVPFNSPFNGVYLISFTVNEVELTRSRESISYTEETKKAITDKFAKVSKEIDAIFQVEIEKQATLLDAAAFINTVRRLDRQYKFKFRGVEHTLDKIITEGQIAAYAALNYDPKTYQKEGYGVSQIYFEKYYRSGYKHILRQSNGFMVDNYVNMKVMGGYGNRNNPKTFTFLKMGKGVALKNRLRDYAVTNNLVNEDHSFILFGGNVEVKLKEICAAYQIDPKLVQDADVLIPRAPRGKRAPGTANVYQYLGNGQWRAEKVASIQQKEIYYAIDTPENRSGFVEAAHFNVIQTVIEHTTSVKLPKREIYLIPKRNIEFFDTSLLTDLKSHVKTILTTHKDKIRAKVIAEGANHKAAKHASKRCAVNIFKKLGYNLSGSDFNCAVIEKAAAWHAGSLESEIGKLAKIEIAKMDAAIAQYPMLDKNCTDNMYGTEVYENKEVAHYIALCDAARAAGIKLDY